MANPGRSGGHEENLPIRPGLRTTDRVVGDQIVVVIQTAPFPEGEPILTFYNDIRVAQAKARRVPGLNGHVGKILSDIAQDIEPFDGENRRAKLVELLADKRVLVD